MAKNKKLKVIIAMSGGVDSSVAAALLKEAGFDVVGIFMRLSSSSLAEKRARKVAKVLKIPFHTLNLKKEFKEKVIDHFLKEHRKGLTPNPCVVCNKEIKFKLLIKKLKSLKADYIATGHYARIKADNLFKILKAKDREKDQSYFLYGLDQKTLKRTLFPNSEYVKKEIVKLAKDFNLPVLNIPESQEICFVATSLNDFLEKHLSKKPGKIIDNEGNIVGTHQGLYFYTIGQRKGIKLPLGPFYVLKKDLKKNLLAVTKNEKDLYKRELIAKNINWIAGKPPKFPLKTKVKIRYRHEAVTATILEDKKKKLKVIFSKDQRAITSGQSVVFYKKQEVLGGGIIDK